MRVKKTNTMRSPEEKESIVLEAFKNGTKKTSSKYDVDARVLNKWKAKYTDKGIEGLRSQTGKTSHGYNKTTGLRRKKHKTKEDELQLKVMQLEIEVARLKKGYLVKGVGTKKEYVTIKDLNMKS